MDQRVRAFTELKRLLTEASVLINMDFQKLFRLETDTSIEGLGTVLAQAEDGTIHPIAYASQTVQGTERTVQGAERNYRVGGFGRSLGGETLPSLHLRP